MGAWGRRGVGVFISQHAGVHQLTCAFFAKAVRLATTSPRSMQTPPLSDLGWAGTLVCGGLLLLLRLLRGKLQELESEAKSSVAAALTLRLWQFSPARLRGFVPAAPTRPSRARPSFTPLTRSRQDWVRCSDSSTVQASSCTESLQGAWR